jgi:perosamine synthetase
MAETEIRRAIPWAEPRYWGNEERYAIEALRSSWISGGPFVDRLEADLQAYTGSPHVVSTSNGTTAIHAAYLGVGLNPGDEVIVPGFAFMAAANIALHMNAVPVFADVDPDTWCMTAQDVEKVVTPRTRGIVPVHTYGVVCDMQPILDLAQERGLWVIEDAAEALGSTYRGRQAGTIAEVGTYSFHATKTITTGEGGAVAARNEEIADRMRLYRTHGVRSRRYFHEVPGHNFRLTNVQAAIGCGQMEQVEVIECERRRLYEEYAAALEGLPGVKLQSLTDDTTPLIWAVGTQLDEKLFPQGRDSVMAAMSAQGIETRPGFAAASEMGHIYGAQDVPVSARLARQVISLPSSPTVTSEEIKFISRTLAAVAQR